MRAFHVLGRKIIGVGSNYRCHVKEMGGSIPTEPIFFLKPVTSYTLEPYPIRIPDNHEVHYEAEIGVVIGRNGANIPVKDAMSHVNGYALALDLTARDLQQEAKAKGLPWDVAKGFDSFCPISNYLSKGLCHDPRDIPFWLKINGEMRQKSNTSELIFPIEELISRISKVMTLERGDFILTGTPAGTGQLKIGDTVNGGFGKDWFEMHYRVVRKPLVLKKCR